MKNRKYIIGSIISILIGLSSILFMDWAEEIKFSNMRNYENNSYMLPIIFAIIVLCIGVIGLIINIILLIKNSKENLKNIKISKIIFKISFIPYVLLLLLAIYSSVFGLGFFSATAYGFEAFYNSILLFGWTYSTIIPIFPIVFIYQVIYIIIILIRKRNVIK